MRRVLVLVLAAFTLVAGAAQAQTTNEDRLREALKRQTADLRAAQDSQAGLQAQIGDLTKQRDAVQQALDQAKAEIAAKAAPAVDEAQLKQLQDERDALRKDNAALQTALAKWQSAYQEAAGVAQAKDAEAKKLDAALKGATTRLGACTTANGKLIATAHDILHMYESQDFRSLLLKSYEPLLGLKRAELENMVQDYEDKIYDAKLTGALTGAKAAP